MLNFFVVIAFSFIIHHFHIHSQLVPVWFLLWRTQSLLLIKCAMFIKLLFLSLPKCHRCLLWWIQNELINMHDHFCVKQPHTAEEMKSLSVQMTKRLCCLQCCKTSWYKPQNLDAKAETWPAEEILINKSSEVFELRGVYVGGCLELLWFPLMREMKMAASCNKTPQW